MTNAALQARLWAASAHVKSLIALPRRGVHRKYRQFFLAVTRVLVRQATPEELLLLDEGTCPPSWTRARVQAAMDFHDQDSRWRIPGQAWDEQSCRCFPS